MSVEVSQRDVTWDAASLSRDGAVLLESLDLAAAELSVLLCDDGFIQPLNKDYRGRDQPTDVLSFAMREGELADPEDPLLGDVVISVQTARRQAALQGHSAAREVQILLVHGLLHLLGQHHGDDEERRRMFAEQARLLALLPTR